MSSAHVADRIFLSHRGVDKALVRDYKLTLDLLGLNPWLDEDDMPAGTDLERALVSGMKNSCAAVFFITPAFVEERYLKAEVTYAISEKRHRDAFAIITLLIPDEHGRTGNVPALLEPYVWKQPTTHLQGLREIIRALPAPLCDIGPRILTAESIDVRVHVGEAQVLEKGEPTLDVVGVKVENHSSAPVFLSGGVSAHRSDNGEYVWFGADALGQSIFPRKLEPGDALSVMLPETGVARYASLIRTFFVSDQLGRHFYADESEVQVVLRNIRDRHTAG